jgi:nucleoside 2-deoxyribosyltransferase
MTTQSRLAARLVVGGLSDATRPRAPGAPAVVKPSPPRQPKIYFADNSRLWPEADAKIERCRVEALCRPRGFECAWPFEHFCFPEKFSTDMAATARVLPKAPLVYLQESAAIVAEVTPFRGVSLNPVIAFELGIAVLLGLPVFAWTAANCAQHPAPHDRMRRYLKGWPFASLAARLVNGTPLSSSLTLGRGCYWDMQGFRVEHFNMVESAVIAGNFTSLSTSIEEAIVAASIYFGRLAKSRRSVSHDAPSAYQ